jgi:hypothetical protein
MSTQPPTVARIVHYTNLGDKNGRFPPEVQAAVITKVHRDSDPGHVSLCIIYETGMFFMKDVPYTDAPAGSEEARGKWTWPARVP